MAYELTDAGRAELERWLDEPSTRGGGFRDDFFIKVMAAARAADEAVLRDVLSRQRTYLLHELRNLHQLRSQHTGNPVVTLLLAAAARHVEADLAFIGDTEETLRLDGGGERPLRQSRSSGGATVAPDTGSNATVAS